MDATFLILSLFLPRVALVWYYLSGSIPTNQIPFIGDFFMSVFIPRVLVLLYIYQNLGAGNGWFVAHVVALILVYAEGGSVTVKRQRAK